MIELFNKPHFYDLEIKNDHIMVTTGSSTTDSVLENFSILTFLGWWNNEQAVQQAVV